VNQSTDRPSWHTEALGRFPELSERLESVATMYELWFELTDSFKKAYQAPKNEDLIARIYAFAEWCCSQNEGSSPDDDLGTCICACFYEEIPTCADATADMPKWFSRFEVLAMKPIFSYQVGEEGFMRILAAYDRKPNRARNA
jgi:hypothetical protein